MRFLSDENVPSSVVVWLRSLGHDVHRAAESNLMGHSDVDLIEWASRKEAMIITSDQDFITIWRQTSKRCGIIVIKTHPPTPDRVENLLKALFSKTRIDKHSEEIIMLGDDAIRIGTH